MVVVLVGIVGFLVSGIYAGILFVFFYNCVLSIGYLDMVTVEE